MKELVAGLLEKSEFLAIVVLILLAVADGQGWINHEIFVTYSPILIGYAGLRAGGKVMKSAVRKDSGIK